MYLNLKDKTGITDMDYHFRKAELSEITPFGNCYETRTEKQDM
jgi:hypothetical protein